ncbi:hypothetical protein CERSUDRAFT_75238, partial [Gelatoporia subvermispora B]
MAPSLRDQQPFVPGAGRLFHSPKKKRLNNVNKAVVRDTARSLEIQRLRKLLEELESQAEPSEAGESGSIASEDPRMPVDDPDPILTQPSLASDGPDAPDRPEGSNFEASDLPSELPDTLEPERKRR